MDHHTSRIFVCNDSSSVAQISQNYRLGVVIELFCENFFHDEINSEYAACTSKQSALLFDQKVTPSGVNSALETCLPNEIMVYWSPKVVQAFQALVMKFTSI